MIFGAEGERLKQLREQQKKQYADDLRKQIAEKNAKPPSPVETQQFPPKSHTSLGPSPPAPLMRTHSPASEPAKPQSSQSRSVPLPALAPTQIGYQQDIIRFADRLAWLEGSLDQHQNTLKHATDSASRLEKTTLPSIYDSIKQLRESLQRVLSTDLPAKLKPLEDEVGYLESTLQSSSSDFSNQIESIKSHLSESNNSIAESQKALQDLSDSIKSSALEEKTEVSSEKERMDSQAQKASKIELFCSQSEDSIKSVNSSVQALEDSIGRLTSAAQQQLSSSISSTSIQIAQDLKQESESRLQSSSMLHAQIDDCAAKSASSIATVQNVINDLSLSFKQSLSALSSSVRDALEASRAESERQFQELTSKLDEVLNQTEKNFTTIESESVATLESLNDHSNKSREAIEASLTQECETRKKNEEQIVDKYNTFKSVIISEMQLQSNQADETNAQVTSKATTETGAALLPLKKEFQQIRTQTKAAEDISDKALTAAASASTLRAQLLENMAMLGTSSASISQSIEALRSDGLLESLEDRLRLLGDSKDTDQFASRKEVEEEFSKLGILFESRIQQIEQQLGVAFSNLSEITMTPPPAGKTPASALLEQLVKEQKSIV